MLLLLLLFYIATQLLAILIELPENNYRFPFSVYSLKLVYKT